MSALPDPDPITADRRRSRQQRRLPADACCLLCAEPNLDALTTVSEALLEEHHVLGRAAAPDVTVPLCRNCHALITAGQHDQQALPPPGRYRPAIDTFPQRLERVLRSLAVFFHALAHTLVGYADQLRTFVAGLDAEYPAWRAAGWAR